MDNNYLQSLTISNYRQTALQMTKLFFPELSYHELQEAIDASIIDNIKDTPAKVYNNYKNHTIENTVLELSNYILSRKPIVTSNGVIFQNHDSGIVNPLSSLFQFYLTDRKRIKAEMFKCEKGSEEYEKLNLAQLLRKISANAIYGLMGLNSSYFYNSHLAPTITRQGKSTIASAILLFESFLGGNIGLGSLDEMIEYIHHIINEPRKYKDEDILDNPVEIEKVWFKVVSSCGFSGYIPDTDDMDIIWNTLSSLGQEDLNRIYYKNNLYPFCDNKSIQNAIVYILERMSKPFLDPNNCPEEILVEMNEFKNLLKEYVYYPHMYQDKIEKVAISFKRVSVLTDTDSSMISLDAWYRYVLNLVYDKPLQIKTQYVDEVEFVDNGNINIVDTDDMILDYDFFTDEFIESKRAVKKEKIIPQDNLRYSILNMMLYVLGDICKNYMQIYSGSYNSYSDDRCLIQFKNEMLMKRIMLQTEARKHYAYYLEMQEGHIVPKERALGVTGMELDKASLQKSTRDRLKRILLENILEPEEIDQRKILVDLIKFEKEIHQSLASGETKYYKPVSIKSMNAYDDPFSIQGIKAAVVYNATRDVGTPALDLNERNNIFVVKVKLNAVNIESLKESNPRIYEALINLLTADDTKEAFKKGITAYGVPQDTPTPKWVLNFIDYYQIINDNIKSFPLESVGLIGRAGNDNVNHSNLLKII